MMFTVKPIGYVRADRALPTDDYWGGTRATIILNDEFGKDALTGLETFSHAEILFYFDRVIPAQIVHGTRHPRNNSSWPQVGIFAQRGKNRPNQIGSTVAAILAVEGKILTVSELDAIDGTPVLDIKPVLREFLPRAPVRQPGWASELMLRYWDLGSPP